MPHEPPESLDLQELLAQMVHAGNKAVAMEVSSHALVQHRARSINFDTAVFTNLTQDHLDYHPTMEQYFEAKVMLFKSLATQSKKKGRAVINIDDRYGHLLSERFKRKVPVITYGQRVGSDFRASDVRFDSTGSVYHLEAKGQPRAVAPHRLVQYLQLSRCHCRRSSMGMELRAAVAAMANAPQVPGRLERVRAKRNFRSSSITPTPKMPCEMCCEH
jgi:UDP-N-acetylmuramoyl-L-alanyl-D-glutamate--2,6-diaminopimelate ligase